MRHPIKYFGDNKENASNFSGRLGVKSIVNIMNNRNELIHPEVTGTEYKFFQEFFQDTGR